MGGVFFLGPPGFFPRGGFFLVPLGFFWVVSFFLFSPVFFSNRGFFSSVSCTCFLCEILLLSSLSSHRGEFLSRSPHPSSKVRSYLGHLGLLIGVRSYLGHPGLLPR